MRTAGPRGGIRLSFALVRFSDAEPSMRRKDLQKLTERAVRVRGKILLRKHRLTFGTVSKAFPLVAETQVVYVLLCQPLCAGTSRCDQLALVTFTS